MQMRIDVQKELENHKSLKEVLRQYVKNESCVVVFYNTPSTPKVLNELLGLSCWIKNKFEKTIEVRFE